MRAEATLAVVDRSASLFTAAFDQASRVGTHLAMEPFVRSRGTGELVAVGGTGGIAVDADDIHRIWFDYELG